jgi:hypothetical protein
MRPRLAHRQVSGKPTWQEGFTSCHVANLSDHLASIDAGQYSVQAVASPGETWMDVLTGISGNGGIVTSTILGGAALRPRFFRVKLLLP